MFAKTEMLLQQSTIAEITAVVYSGKQTMIAFWAISVLLMLLFCYCLGESCYLVAVVVAVVAVVVIAAVAVVAVVIAVVAVDVIFAQGIHVVFSVVDDVPVLLMVVVR